MSGHDRRYALPELQQWEAAKTDDYVWGDPAAIESYGKALDRAGADLATLAQSLGGIDVAAFWNGPAAAAFTQLKGRVVPAVEGLATMQKDAATALGTWKRHLAEYKEDCAGAITTGKQGWHLYKTTTCDNPDARTKMANGRNGISSAQASSLSAGRTCKTQLETAATKAGGPAVPAAAPATRLPGQISTTPGQVGTAPSGREPVPMVGPVPAGQPWPYVDPANGRTVVPKPGPWAVGHQPWEYADRAPAGTLPSLTTGTG